MITLFSLEKFSLVNASQITYKETTVAWNRQPTTAELARCGPLSRLMYTTAPRVITPGVGLETIITAATRMRRGQRGVTLQMCYIDGKTAS